jgi:hypothetical protein
MLEKGLKYVLYLVKIYYSIVVVVTFITSYWERSTEFHILLLCLYILYSLMANKVNIKILLFVYSL